MMVAYSFHKRFIGHVLAGLEPGPWLPGMKRHTLRAPREGRSQHARPEQPVQLYTAMRTKHCRQLGRAVCRLQMPVELVFAAGMLSIRRRWGATPRSKVADLAPIVQQLLTRDRLESPAEMDEFARADGFVGLPAMVAYFETQTSLQTYHLNMVLIAWSPEVAE